MINTDALVQEPEPFVIPPTPCQVCLREVVCSEGRESAAALLQHLIEASEDGPNGLCAP